MPPITPEILLLHGGWHTPSSYRSLTTALMSLGYIVHCPLLPSMSGTNPPVDDLYTDSAHVRSLANALVSRGTYLVVLMHSYGGQVGTNALTSLSAASRARFGLPGGIIHLIYMTAYAVTEGVSMTGWVTQMGHAELLPMAFDFSEDGFVTSKYPKELVIGEGELGEKEMEEYMRTWTSWAVKGWGDEVKGCAWREEVGVSYIMTMKDGTIPVEYQRAFVKGMDEGRTVEGRERVEVLEVQAGHCLNVSATGRVVEIVKGIVERERGKVPVIVAAAGEGGGVSGA